MGRSEQQIAHDVSLSRRRRRRQGRQCHRFRLERTRCATGWCCRRRRFPTTKRLSRHPSWIRIKFCSKVETKFEARAANAIRLGKREQGVRQAGAVAVVVSPSPHASLGIQVG